MAQPVFVNCNADTWTKVASGVVGARIWHALKANNYVFTYVDAGEAAPTVQEQGVWLKSGLIISVDTPIDIYVWSIKKNGRVRVDLGVGATAGFDSVGGSIKVSETNPPHTYGPIGPEELITSAQALTAAWVDLGAEIEMGGYTELLLWLTLDINNSLDVRVRILVKHEQGGTEEYTLPIQTVSASDVKVEPHYYEFNIDADQLMVLPFHLPNDVLFAQVQIMAGTAGATPGEITGAQYTRSWAGGGEE